MIENQQEPLRLTVSELNRRVKGLLEGSFPPLWVEGEVSNFASPASGHWYFTLKDENSQLRCAMFHGSNQLSRFVPESGMQLLAYGQVTLYSGRGDYQMVIKHIEPLGSGALQLAFEQLKKRLAAEGLFADKHKQLLPQLPQRVGIITSATGAAIHDILRVLKRRYPLLEVIIYPTLVQGEGAAAQIVSAIETANSRDECDLLIMARGGGSLEDLWAFNEESVARAIFASELAIVSAVGHEVDFTIADFVADYRAATPSAAAELISPDCQELMQSLDYSLVRLKRQLDHHLERISQQLQGLVQRFYQQHPEKQLQLQQQQLQQLQQRLILAQQHHLQNSDNRLQTLVRALNAISPLATLARGYSIVRKLSAAEQVGEIVYRSDQLKKSDALQLILHQGQIDCQVTKIKKH
ncbi:MAG: exodeoxyribonuclease VII large subunit [Gammaproteobacteria bacterium]|nr:exodeoxyribonuclease VII large subunit [Gammaproteobacteria bacterium]